MAPGDSRPCHFPYQNLPPIDLVKDEFARDLGSVGGPYSGSTSPALSCNPTPSPELVFALIPAPVPAPALLFSDRLFKQFMTAYLKLNQGLRQPLAERERFLKAKILEVDYGKLHIDCYHFWQQCKDHFKIAGATGANRTPFAAFFLRGSISG